MEGIEAVRPSCYSCLTTVISKIEGVRLLSYAVALSSDFFADVSQ